MRCQDSKCADYLKDDGWCLARGMPAEVAIEKCPKQAGSDTGREKGAGEQNDGRKR
jgi:hypothetical protein